MNIICNEKLIQRNKRIGLIATIVGLLVLAGGMWISFKYQQYSFLSILALFIGFALAQVGILYSNKYGRSPRPDELINRALKGFGEKYTIFHYSSPVSHLLLGPAGVWVIQPYHQKGTIYYQKGRWKQKGGNWYLKIFAQEGLGRPDLNVSTDLQAMRKFFSSHLEEAQIPPINVALVFTNPNVEIILPEDETPIADTLILDKLKDHIRKNSKGKTLSPQKLGIIQGLFQE